MSIWDTGLVHSDRSWEIAIIYLRSILVPTLFLVSGLFLTRRLANGTATFFRNWLVAIVWPYLLWGTVIVVAERAMGGIRSPVDTSPTDLSLVWTPIAWLWFLYVFAILQLLAVACRRAPRVLVALAVAALVVDALIPLPLLAHLCCYHLIFYAVGVAYGPTLAAWRIPSLVGLGALIASVPLALIAVPDIAHLWTWRIFPPPSPGSSAWPGSGSGSRAAGC